MICLLYSRKQFKSVILIFTNNDKNMALFQCFLVVFLFFRHKHVLFPFNKGENRFAALTNITILKTQNYWREMIT